MGEKITRWKRKE